MEFLATFLSLFQQGFYFIAAALGFGFIIGFHEFGHFLFCKLFKVSTPTFSIGFGPRLFSRKIGDTEFTLSAIPFGGYVEIAGNAEVGQGDQKEATRNDDASFSRKPWYQKFLIMCGGILFNLFFAFVAFTLVFMAGMPRSMILYPTNATNVVNGVIVGSPAQQAGFKKLDTVIASNGKPVTAATTPELIKELLANPNVPVTLTVERAHTDEASGQTLKDSPEKTAMPDSATLPTAPQTTTTPTQETAVTRQDIILPVADSIASTGLIFQVTALPRYGFIEAHKKGFLLVVTLIRGTLDALKTLFKGNTASLSGPVGVIVQTAQGAQSGFLPFILFLAYISISLAVMNIIPLPILDGGQILFGTIESIIGREIPLKAREYIHIGSWLLALGLMLYLTTKDILCLAAPYCNAVMKLFGY